MGLSADFGTSVQRRGRNRQLGHDAVLLIRPDRRGCARMIALVSPIAGRNGEPSFEADAAALRSVTC